MWKMSIRVIITHVPTVLCALYYCFLFSDWSDEAVTNAEILRLIYQGRFLHCNVTLSALGLATGKTTVMHLVPRENLPEPNSQGMHCILSSLYVFLVNILDSRVPWFLTLNNRKCKSKDKKENSHASFPQRKLAKTKFTRYALGFICFLRVCNKYLGF